MKIGQLRHQVVFRAPQTTRATDGSINISYVGSTNVWARVVSKGSSESEQTTKQTTASVIEVLVRYNPFTSVVDTTYEVMWEGKQYNIGSIEVDEKKESILITATNIK